MNKNVIGFIAVLVLFFVIAATFVGYAVWEGASNDRSSRAWVETHLPQVLSDWSVAQLKQDASSSYLNEITFRGRLSADFQHWSQLGKLEQLGELSGQSGVSFPKADSHKDPIYTASYQVEARFAHGKADISVELRMENDAWKWQSFKLVRDNKGAMP